MGAISGIPTTHKGVRYRSRLEAKWAAMFDLLGWRFQYEPMDLDGWIPDFALLGKGPPVLVEVKPALEFDEATAADIERAILNGPQHDVLLLGAVLPQSGHYYPGEALGWLGESIHSPDGVCLGWGPAEAGRTADGGWDFFHGDHSWRYRLTDVYDGNAHVLAPEMGDLQSLFDAAGNSTQWRAR